MAFLGAKAHGSVPDANLYILSTPRGVQAPSASPLSWTQSPTRSQSERGPRPLPTSSDFPPAGALLLFIFKTDAPNMSSMRLVDTNGNDVLDDSSPTPWMVIIPAAAGGGELMMAQADICIPDAI